MWCVLICIENVSEIRIFLRCLVFYFFLDIFKMCIKINRGAAAPL